MLKIESCNLTELTLISKHHTHQRIKMYRVASKLVKNAWKRDETHQIASSWNWRDTSSFFVLFLYQIKLVTQINYDFWYDFWNAMWNISVKKLPLCLYNKIRQSRVNTILFINLTYLILFVLLIDFLVRLSPRWH